MGEKLDEVAAELAEQAKGIGGTGGNYTGALNGRGKENLLPPPKWEKDFDEEMEKYQKRTFGSASDVVHMTQEESTRPELLKQALVCVALGKEVDRLRKHGGTAAEWGAVQRQFINLVSGMPL